MKFILILILYIFLSACYTDDIVTPSLYPTHPEVQCPNYESEHLNILWQSPIQKDTTRSFSMIPRLHENKILFSDFLSQDNKETLKAFDKTTGERLWEWDGLNPEIGTMARTIGNQIYNSNIYLSSRKDLYKVDLTNGGLVWERDITYSNPRIIVIDDKIFYTKDEVQGQVTLSSTLVQLDEHGNAKNLFTRYIENDYEPAVQMPSLAINSSSDSLLILLNRSYNYNGNVRKGAVNIIAYNLSKSQLEWEKKDIVPNGYGSIFLPIVREDKVYIQGGTSIYSLNVEDGSENWNYQFVEGSFTACAGLIIGDKWILNRDTRAIYAFDINTGTQIWQNDDTGSTVDNMDYYQDHVYFGSGGTGKLYKVNIHTGEKVYETGSPNRACDDLASFAVGVTIDRETGLLYTMDEYFAMCIDLK